jgi:hypothetical protein
MRNCGGVGVGLMGGRNQPIGGIADDDMQAYHIGPGRAGRRVITTDGQGRITMMRTVVQRVIRDAAFRFLDVSQVNFNLHDEERFHLIEAKVDGAFFFDPPLPVDYVKNYLKDAIPTTRHDWRKYWLDHGTKHPQCPVSRYQSLVAYWQTQEMEFESAKDEGSTSSENSIQEEETCRRRR